MVELEDETFGSNCTYELVRYLAKGAFGTIHEGVIKERGDFAGEDVVAIKFVDLRPMEQLPSVSDEKGIKMLYRLKRLVTVDLKHSHLIAYHKVFVHIMAGSLLSYEILMDYCTGGDLATHLRDLSENKTSLDELGMTCYALQLADGLAFLHSIGIMHMDLKPGNILMKRTADIHRTLLIGDLDEFIQMHRSKTSAKDISGFRGTVHYSSPEMIRSKGVKRSDEVVGRKADMWSLGCVILDIANFGAVTTVHANKWLYNPETGLKEEIKINEVGEYEFPNRIIAGWVPFVADTIPGRLAECIQKCLVREYSERISASDLFKRLRKVVTTQTQDNGSVGIATSTGKCFCIKSASDNEKNYIVEDFQEDRDGNEYLGSNCIYAIVDKIDQPIEMPNNMIINARVYKVGNMRAIQIPSNIVSAFGRILERGNFGGDETIGLKVFIPQTQESFDELDNSPAYLPKARELCKLLRNFRHPHLIPFHKVTLTRHGEKRIEFMTDYKNVAGDDMTLYENMWNRRISLGDPAVVCYALQMAEGLKFLHANDLVHGSLNLTSVVVKRTPTGHHVLLIDTVNRFQQVDGSVLSAKFLLQEIDTFFYASPELLNRLFAMDEEVVGCKTDVWSLGCIISELANFGKGIRAKWLHKKITGEKNLIPEDLPRIVFARKLQDNFLPYVAGAIAECLVKCIKQCLVLHTAYRSTLDDLIPKLQQAAQELSFASPDAVPAEETFPCDCAVPASDTSRQDTEESGSLVPSAQYVLVFHYWERMDEPESKTNLYVQLYNASTASLTQLPLPSALLGRQFLPFFLLQNDEITLYVKSVILDKRQQIVDVVACDFLQQAWHELCFTLHNFGLERRAVTANGMIYFWNVKKSGSYLHEMDISDGSITAVPNPTSETLSDAYLVVYEGKIVCCAEDSNLKQTWMVSFDPQTRIWQQLSPLPASKKQFAVAVVDHYLYILGGFKTWTSEDGKMTSQTYESQCIRLKMQSTAAAWEIIPDIPVPFYDHGTFVIGKKIYLFGGSAKHDVPRRQSDLMQVYDTEKGVWFEADYNDNDKRDVSMYFRRTQCLPFNISASSSAANDNCPDQNTVRRVFFTLP